MKILIGIFILFFLVNPLQAQEDWSLIKCIDYALKNNLDHKTYELSEQSAKIDASQSKLNLLPSLSASSSAGINFGRSVDPNSNDIINTEFFNNSNRLNSNVSLFRGFTQINRIAFSKFRLEAAKWQKINFEDDLAFGVMIAYYDVTYFQGLVEIAKEQLELSGYNLKKTQTQIETGLKAKTDLAEMQAIYEMEKLNLIQSENRLEEAKLKLSQQINLPAGQIVQVRSTSEESVSAINLPLSADSLFTSFVNFSPYVKIATADLNAEEKNVAISKGQFSPSLSMNASINTGYSETNKDKDGNTTPFKDQIDNNMSQYIGATLSIPIFSRNQIRNDLRKARIAKEQAETRVENYKKAVYYELQNNTRDLMAFYREYHQTKKQIEADELSYKVAERKYNEGMIDVIEMLTVKNRLAQTKSQLLRSEIQWKIKDKLLDFYTGIRFWEIN